MNKPITLDDNDWGQIIDGLTCHAEQYEETVRYYETDEADGGIAEVSDAEEARELAETYRSLIKKIQRQR
ncbi:MAG TPA: hypothetical protein DCS43_01105 [Verrucomicrobia bacterium]|nr:hypothetical protein [Verrucomicrobiota bacterium]